MLKIVPIMPKIMPEFAHYAPTMPTAQYYGRVQIFDTVQKKW